MKGNLKFLAVGIGMILAVSVGTATASSPPKTDHKTVYVAAPQAFDFVAHEYTLVAHLTAEIPVVDAVVAAAPKETLLCPDAFVRTKENLRYGLWRSRSQKTTLKRPGSIKTINGNRYLFW